MRKINLLWTLLLGCVFCFSVVGCTSKDESEDNETYKTRDYIIGIGKWDAQKVKKADGTWSTNPRDDAKHFVLEFFDKKAGSSDRQFKSWEYIKRADSEDVDEVKYEGVYTVNGRTISCSVNGQQYLRFVVTTMANNELGGTVTFYKDNMTFDVSMTRTW